MLYLIQSKPALVAFMPNCPTFEDAVICGRSLCLPQGLNRVRTQNELVENLQGANYSDALFLHTAYALNNASPVWFYNFQPMGIGIFEAMRQILKEPAYQHRHQHMGLCLDYVQDLNHMLDLPSREDDAKSEFLPQWKEV